MAESTLSLSYPDFLQEVGYFCTFGRDTGAYTADQASLVDALIRDGYSQFLFPPVLEGETQVHVWSFLHPWSTVTTASGTEDYDLPDDFGGVVGDMSLDDGSLHAPIVRRSQGQIEALRTQAPEEGRPKAFAIRPKVSTGATGQRFEVMFWPEPDGIHVIDYRYARLIGKLTTLLPYPLGGASHGRTVLASCLAMAELRVKEIHQGAQWGSFMELLKSSIRMDRQLMTPDKLGPNKDDSDAPTDRRIRSQYVTYEGTIYGL